MRDGADSAALPALRGSDRPGERAVGFGVGMTLSVHAREGALIFRARTTSRRSSPGGAGSCLGGSVRAR